MEGSSRYLLEYFELFHAMKKTHYSRYLNEDPPDRRERMSECVEARTGDGFIKHLAKMHAIDSQQHDDGILDRCEASELSISHMSNVLRFLKRQLPADEQTEFESSVYASIERGITIGKKRSIDDKTLEQASTKPRSNRKSPPAKKSTSVKRETDSSAKGTWLNGRFYPKQKGIFYHRYNKKWEVKTSTKKYLGSFKKYEDAVERLRSYEKTSTENIAARFEQGVTRDVLESEQTSPAHNVASSSNDSEKIVGFGSTNNHKSGRPKSGMKCIYWNKQKGNWMVTKGPGKFIGTYQTKEEAIEALKAHGNSPDLKLPRPRGRPKAGSKSIDFDQLNKKWQVTADDGANLGSFTNYEDALVTLKSHSDTSTENGLPSVSKKRAKGNIYYRKDRKCWRVRINGKHVGTFKSHDEALEARQQAVDNYYSRTAIECGAAPPRKRAKTECTVNASRHVKQIGNDGAPIDAANSLLEMNDKCQYISYYPEREKWIVRLGKKDDRKYIGAYSTYEEAVSELKSYYDSQQTPNKTERTISEVRSFAKPNSGFALMKHGKLDPTYLLGMSIMLFNPVDNSYHSGRIVHCTLNAPTSMDELTKAPILGRLVDNEIAETLYLVRFREGADGRKVSIHQWLYLEEHAVRVGGEVCWAKVADGMGDRMSPYRPVQIIYRSMLERISTLQESGGYETKSSDAVGVQASISNVLAMGFGASFSFIRISLQDENYDIVPGHSLDDSKPSSLDSSSERMDVENMERIKNHPIIFPFGVKDPSWLNQILHHVRLRDEDIGIAVAMAMTEQNANRRVRYSIQ